MTVLSSYGEWTQQSLHINYIDFSSVPFSCVGWLHEEGKKSKKGRQGEGFDRSVRMSGKIHKVSNKCTSPTTQKYLDWLCNLENEK